MAIKMTSTIASCAREPALNHFSTALFVITKITDEFIKRANDNFIATDTFIFVIVSCFSFNENLLIAKRREKLII